MGANSNQTEMEKEIVFQITPSKAIEALQKGGALTHDSAPKSNGAAHTNFQLCWDTRILPDNKPVLFVARKGGKFDGHSLAKDFLSRGYIFVGEPGTIMKHLRNSGETETSVQHVIQNENFLPVHETELALKVLLNAALEFPPELFTSIAITGTSGKTSTTQIAAFLLEKLAQKNVVRLGTLGIQIGPTQWEGSHPTMPDYPGFLSALTASHRQGVHHAVFEATSHGLVGGRLGDWLADVTVFCNFSQDHLDFHKTMAAYRSCKGILFEKHLKTTGAAVVNTDDKEWSYFLSRLSERPAKIVGFGSGIQRESFFSAAKQKCENVFFLQITNPVSNNLGIQGAWELYGQNQKIQEARFACPLLGGFQLHNLAAAAASLFALGFHLTDIAATTKEIPNIPGRLEHVKEPSVAPHPTVLVDYAHKPDALEKTLQTLKSITPPGGKLISVFGCGGDRDASKRPIMGEISSKIADITYITSDNPRTEDPARIVGDVMKGIPAGTAAKSVVDRREAIFEAIINAGNNDIVVIAGKGHEDYQIVGSQKFPFSDFDVARQALLSRQNSC